MKTKMTGSQGGGYVAVPPQLMLQQLPIPARTLRRIAAKLARRKQRKAGAV